MPHRALSIRTSLALLVATCVLPGSLVTSFLIFDEYRVRHAQLANETVTTARALVSALDLELATIESGLQVLAVSPQLATNDLTAFHSHAKEALPSQKALNYVLVDAQGRQALNTLRPFGDKLPVTAASREAMTVFETGKTTVTDIFVGPVSGKPTMAMAVPVRQQGRIVYALNVGILPERIAGVLENQRLPEGWIGVITDGTGTIIARTHDNQRYQGQKVVPELVSAMQYSDEGIVEMRSLEGIPVISAFSRSQKSHWNAAVGIPQSVLTSGLRRSLWLVIASTVAMMLGGLGLAWLYGARISNAFRGLMTLASELGEGRLIRAPVFRLREANAVGQSMVEASTQLFKAQHDAYHDPLTSLANRALFHQILKQQLTYSQRENRPMGVLYIDLDGFKTVNDTQGHAAGDHLLRMTAQRIQDSVRGSDLAARLGGDEFAVLLAGSSLGDARLVADKLIAILSQPYQLLRAQVNISASIGIAVYPESATTAEDLLQQADAAMYAAKKAGKGRCMVA